MYLCDSQGTVSIALQVEEMLNAGIFDMQQYADEGWVTGLKYEDEVREDLKKRTGGKKDKLRSVSALTATAKCTPYQSLLFYKCLLHVSSSRFSCRQCGD